MVFQVVSSTAARGLKASGKTITARRSMGTAPKTDWTGADAVVRKYFPEDYQVAGAILSGYAGLISLAALRSKMKGSPPEAAPVPAAASSSAPASDVLPSVESPDFENFLESDAFGKFVESEDSLMKWVDSVAAE